MEEKQGNLERELDPRNSKRSTLPPIFFFFFFFYLATEKEIPPLAWHARSLAMTPRILLVSAE